ncbi:Protein get1 [Frankliniella fusca]|uniref:Protein get1 n=1 Tax=Frankliniella fusca TaxID=407009 RepID=A0AAE1LE87_9NEOP|nr:Protein get1 [Frankliniella fusca]
MPSVFCGNVHKKLLARASLVTLRLVPINAVRKAVRQNKNCLQLCHPTQSQTNAESRSRRQREVNTLNIDINLTFVSERFVRG